MSVLDDIKKQKDAAKAGKVPPEAQQGKSDVSRPLVTKDKDGNDVVNQSSQPLGNRKLQDDSKIITADHLSGENNPDLSNAIEPGVFLYTCPHSDGWSIHLSDGEARAKDGLLKLNADQHAEIQKLIKSGRPDIAQNAIFLDPKAAEQIVKDYQARHKRPEAGKGAMNVHMEAQHAQDKDYAVVLEKNDGTYVSAASHNGSAAAILANAIEENAFSGDDLNVDPVTGLPIVK